MRLDTWQPAEPVVLLAAARRMLGPCMKLEYAHLMHWCLFLPDARLSSRMQTQCIT